MNIQFQIEYRTQWGEELRVQLWTVSKGDTKQAVDELTLSTSDGLMWTGDMHLDIQQPLQGDTVAIEYQYAMWREGSLVWTEWEVAPHRVALDGITDNYVLDDKWRPIPEDLPLFSSAYTECVGTRPDGTTDYVAGANISAFMKVARAMMAQGIL